MATLKNTTINDTGYLKLPVGTTSQRPGTPSTGMTRWNSTDGNMEMYDGSAWSAFSLAGSFTTSNAIIWLDAGDSNSYSGSGTVWYDLSGTGNNFNIVASAYQSGAQPYMDFRGSYGMAKTSSDISLNDANGVTYFLITRVLESTSTWRTLTRGYSYDHQVIIQSGAWNVGMYDSASAFFDSGGDQTSFPNYGTSNWVALYWRWQSSSPYYKYSWNDTPGTTRGSITNSTARYNYGFGSLGGYHGGSTSPSSGSQYWGDIAVFAVYNSYLTDAELLTNYNYYKTKYSLP